MVKHNFLLQTSDFLAYTLACSRACYSPLLLDGLLSWPCSHSSTSCSPEISRRLACIPSWRSRVVGSQVRAAPATIAFLLRRRRRSATATTEATAVIATEVGSKARAWRSGVLISTFPTSVAALSITTITPSATTRAAVTTVVTTHHAAGRSVRALLLDVRLRDDLGGEMEPFAQVVEALRSQGVVVPLP